MYKIVIDLKFQAKREETFLPTFRDKLSVPLAGAKQSKKVVLRRLQESAILRLTEFQKRANLKIYIVYRFKKIILILLDSVTRTPEYCNMLHLVIICKFTVFYGSH